MLLLLFSSFPFGRNTHLQTHRYFICIICLTIVLNGFCVYVQYEHRLGNVAAVCDFGFETPGFTGHQNSWFDSVSLIAKFWIHHFKIASSGVQLQCSFMTCCLVIRLTDEFIRRNIPGDKHSTKPDWWRYTHIWVLLYIYFVHLTALHVSAWHKLLLLSSHFHISTEASKGFFLHWAVINLRQFNPKDKSVRMWSSTWRCDYMLPLRATVWPWLVVSLF